MVSPTLRNNLLSWSMSAGMRAAYQGSAQLSNEVGQWDTTLLWTPFAITLYATATADGLDVSPMTGNLRWVWGVITSVELGEAISEKVVNLQISSFYAKLSSKPVNTEKYDATVEEVLTELATVFGGIPAGMFSFAPCEARIDAVISGSNLLDEMRRVAQAGGQDLFVRHDGVLVTENWKDSTSPVQLVLPREMVVSARLQVAEGVGPSRIKVRGKFISQFDEGKQQLISSGTGRGKGGGEGGGGGQGSGGGGGGDPPNDDRPRGRGNRGAQGLCIRNGVGVPLALAKLRNVRGNAEDIRNAEVVIRQGLLTFGGYQHVYNNGVDIQMLGPDSQQDNFLGNGDHEVQIRLQGRVRPKDEFVSVPSIFGPYKAQVAASAAQQNAIYTWLLNGGKALTLPLGGGGGKAGARSSGGASNTLKDKTPDETEMVQIETTVDDPDLIAEFGVVVEEISNIYLSTHEQMVAAAVRRFQEFKMSRAAWEVESAYIPDLRLNQVVTLTIPDGTYSVTGLVTGLTIDSQPGPSAAMRFTLESFDQMGATNYTSGNLLARTTLRAIDNEHTWFVSDEEKFTGSDGVVAMETETATPLTVEQEVALVVGQSYTATYDGKTIGDGTMLLTIEDGLGVLTSDGGIAIDTIDSTVSFVARERLTTLKWTVTPGGGPTLWFMSRPVLTKSLTA